LSYRIFEVLDGEFMPWDPVQFLAYSHYRLRPALDLINRIPIYNPAYIVDLGCGVGNITRQLEMHWPEAKITGVDSSGNKLLRARQTYPDIDWQHADIEDWTPSEPVDLFFSNSALQWQKDHDLLFLKLLTMLAPSGVLAVQISRNFTQPSHRALYKTAREGPWSNRLEHLIIPEPCKTPEYYWDLLAPYVHNLDIWETIYLQAFEGENPVTDFMRPTWLRRFLDQLEIHEQMAFEESFRKKVQSAYPKRPDGKTLLPYRRLFIVVQKK
jgi:trans-aconitate 2-methyltransferase